MIARILRKLSLILMPPKKADVYYGDTMFFIVGNPIEHILHGLKDKYGNNIHSPVPSFDCYRLTIENSYETYYFCKSEVFCRKVPEHSHDIGNWKTRSQPRRLPSAYFNSLIVSGHLKKEKV